MIVEKTNTGYSAYCEEHTVYTTGKTKEELKANAIEAFELHFEETLNKFDKKDLLFKFP